MMRIGGYPTKPEPKSTIPRMLEPEPVTLVFKILEPLLEVPSESVLVPDTRLLKNFILF